VRCSCENAKREARREALEDVLRLPRIYEGGCESVPISYIREMHAADIEAHQRALMDKVPD
jgi:hypothetical protein